MAAARPTSKDTRAPYSSCAHTSRPSVSVPSGKRWSVNGGISGVLRAEARDEVAAENLRDVIRGFIALAKMQAGSRPEILASVQALQLGGTGKTVALSFDVPEAVFELLGHARASQSPR